MWWHTCDPSTKAGGYQVAGQSELQNKTLYQKVKNQESNEVIYIPSIRHKWAFEYFILYLPLIKYFLFVWLVVFQGRVSLHSPVCTGTL